MKISREIRLEPRDFTGCSEQEKCIELSPSLVVLDIVWSAKPFFFSPPLSFGHAADAWSKKFRPQRAPKWLACRKYTLDVSLSRWRYFRAGNSSLGDGVFILIIPVSHQILSEVRPLKFYCSKGRGLPFLVYYLFGKRPCDHWNIDLVTYLSFPYIILSDWAYFPFLADNVDTSPVEPFFPVWLWDSVIQIWTIK